MHYTAHFTFHTFSLRRLCPSDGSWLVTTQFILTSSLFLAVLSIRCDELLAVIIYLLKDLFERRMELWRAGIKTQWDVTVMETLELGHPYNCFILESNVKRLFVGLESFILSWTTIFMLSKLYSVAFS